MGKSELAHICYEVPKELKIKLMIRAAEKGIRQREVVIEALSRYLTPAKV
jgi:hypothetical protein